jgi:transcriptional regulator with XRE-family HTH domain
MLSEKLILLRKERGYSQEQLANHMEVSRQAVSKWESGQSTPDLDKLIQLSELFSVSLDYLLKDGAERSYDTSGNSSTADSYQSVVDQMNSTNEIKDQLNEISHFIRKAKGYEYKSKRNILGIPLVHILISYSRQPKVAKGIIAIGNISLGLISIGGLSLGAFSFAGIGIGLLALGGISIGLVALGAIAIGILAVGAVAIGIYGLGASVIAKEVAVGAAATGKVAIGKAVEGKHVMQIDQMITKEIVRDFIHQYCPNIWEPILRIVTCVFK